MFLFFWKVAAKLKLIRAFQEVPYNIEGEGTMILSVVKIGGKNITFGFEAASYYARPKTYVCMYRHH